MNPNDARVRYTKMVLKQSLLKILQDKPIDRVNIKELCEMAKVNRGTFYLHYSCPRDLLREIENEFVQENLELFSPYVHKRNDVNLLAEMFSCILNNADTCRILMGPNGSTDFVLHLSELMRPFVMEDWKKQFPSYSDADLEFVYRFVFAGATRAIIGWLNDSESLSIENLARRLDRLGHYCHLAIREFNIQKRGG